MKKAELVTAAVDTGLWSKTQAKKMTVLELRERLRQMKAAMEPVCPLLKLPVGLERMKKVDLELECAQRDIDTTELHTRAQMIVAIKDDLEQRNTESEATESMETDVAPKVTRPKPKMSSSPRDPSSGSTSPALAKK